MSEITSLQNPRVKAAVRLRDGRHRQRSRRIIVDGVREIDRALGAGVRLVEAFVLQPLCTSEAQSLVSRLEQSGTEVIQVSQPVFEKLAFGSRAEGIVAVAETPSAALGDLVLPENPLVAVLEGLEKPGNVGAVLRSADAAGVSAVIVADPRTDLYNPNAIRASLGTIFTMPLVEAPAADVLDWLGSRKLAVYAARVDGSRPYTEVDFRRPAAIVLGSEAAGLSRLWHGNNVTAIRLPMLGTADSLNVSTTAAVLFYEAVRQRS